MKKILESLVIALTLMIALFGVLALIAVISIVLMHLFGIPGVVLFWILVTLTAIVHHIRTDSEEPNMDDVW
jgi:hypothetical protein